jgi:hypothetical protein
LSDVHEAVAGHKRRAASEVITHDLGGQLVYLQLATATLFSPILERQDHVNGIRNALSMVTANRFLFNLPERCAPTSHTYNGSDWLPLFCSVKAGIETENWSQVIQDYRKAKQLFATTDNEIFRKV